MRRHPRAVSVMACVLAACAAGPRAAWSWTPPMDDRVTFEASRLMPASLRSILERHAEALRAGAREAASEEPATVHAFDAGQKEASAASRLEELVPRAVSAIDDHRPFEEVARLLGRIAHYAGDLNNPLQVASDDPHEDRYATQYTVYVERNLPKYPLVFYGWDDEALDTAASARQGVRAFAERTARRSRPDYAPIRAAYDPANPAPRDRRFDERSLPFGIGSLSWSRTVTDTARLWRHVWRLAHGDMAGTPYTGGKAVAAPVTAPGKKTAAAPEIRPDSGSKPAGPGAGAGSSGPAPPAVKVIRPKVKPKPAPPDPNAAASDPNAGASDPNAPAPEGGLP